MVSDIRDYGIRGDGTTDDAPAIQSAVDAARGELYLPPGTYRIGEPGRVTPTIELGSGMTLRGAGAATILQRAQDGYAAPMIRAEGDGITIADLAIDGSRGNTLSFVDHTNQQGIWLSRAKDCVISRVWVYGQRTNGIALEYCEGVMLSQCIAYSNLKNGFYLSGSDRVTLTGCIGHGNGSPGIPGYLVGSSFSVACSWHCTLSGCIGWGDVGASLLTGRDTQRLSVVGGSFEGVDVSAEPVGATPPGLDRTGQAGPYDGKAKYGTSHSVFTGLTIQSRFHGVRFFGGWGNMVNGCIIRNCALNGIMLYGSSGNVIRGNYITNVGRAGNKDYQAGIVVVADAVWPDATANVIDSNELPGDAQPVHVYALPGGHTEGTRQS